MSLPVDFLPPTDLKLPEEWLSRFAAALDARKDVERAYLVRERYPHGIEQPAVHYELVHPPGDDGASTEFVVMLAQSIPPLPDGMIFTCTPRRLLADVHIGGRLIWERSGPEQP